ncbi:hypothetical protein ES703_70989 [subsurface metagenome]
MKDNKYEELIFKDWIQLQEWNDPDWIVLSRYTSGINFFWTHSVLLYLDRIGDIEKSDQIGKITQNAILELLFSDYYLNNELHGDFGIPDVLEEPEGIIFNDEFVDDRGLKFRPIVYTTDYSEDLRKTDYSIEITPCPKFSSLYRLKRKSSNYTRIDRMGNEVEVIKIYTGNGNTIMKVSTKYIRDFLTLSNMALVRIHSHQRIRNDDFREEEHFDKDDQHFYKIMVANSVFVESRKPGITRSLLRGIDVILPYTNPINENRILGPRPDHIIEFIIGRNDDGTNKTMNPKNAAYSSGTFLLPVCFNKDILQKFYQKPEIYTISEGQSIKGPGYHLPYNNTPENSIMVYLGDLDGLPLEELHYFQAYNIPCPKESITEDRFRRDFLAEFAEPEELEFHLKINLQELNQTFQSQFHFPLFKLSRVEVKDYLKQIHIPLTREKKEFKDVILAAEKVFVESISSVELKTLILNSDQFKDAKSLKVLEEFLRQEFPILTNSIKYLFYLQELRSTLAAHLSGKTYQKFLIKHQFNETETIEIIDWVLKGILVFIKKFNQSLKRKKAV